MDTAMYQRYGTSSRFDSGREEMSQRHLLYYLLREGFVGHARELLDNCMLQCGREDCDMEFLFWKAYTLGMEGSIQDAIRGLQEIQTNKDAELAAGFALKFFRTSSSRDVIMSNESEVLTRVSNIEEGICSPVGLLLASRYLWLTKETRSACHVLDKLLSYKEASVPNNTLHQETLALYGWVTATTWHAENSEKWKNGNNPLMSCKLESHLDVHMGRTACAIIMAAKALQPNADPAEFEYTTSNAVEHLNRAIAIDPTFWPSLVQKALLLGWTSNWEEALELADTVLAIEGQDENCQALQLKALHSYLWNGDTSESVSLLQRLVTSLHKWEPRCAALHYEIAAIFARVCGKSVATLRITTDLVNYACQLSRSCSHFVEAGYQQRLVGSYGSAAEAFSHAGDIQQGNTQALLGQVRCLIEEGLIQDAEQQLELLTIAQGPGKTGIELAFLRSLLARRKDCSETIHEALLDDVKDHLGKNTKYLNNFHDGEGKRICSSLLYSKFLIVDPNVILELAEMTDLFTFEYLLHVEGNGLLKRMPINVKMGGWGSIWNNIDMDNGGTKMRAEFKSLNAVQKGLELLDSVVSLIPGSLPARLLQVGLHLSCGRNLNAASDIVKNILAKRPCYYTGHLIHARVDLEQGDYRAAETSVEYALTHDPKLRSSPLYHLLSARIASKNGNLVEAAALLDDALRQPGVREGVLKPAMCPLSCNIELFIEIIKVLSTLGRYTEAQQVITEVQSLCQTQYEEFFVLAIRSQLAVEQGDFGRAAHILETVSRLSPSYTETQVLCANIHLIYQHDKQAYARCHEEICAFNPTAPSFMCLGESYLRIQMPEAAIKAFEKALDADPSCSGAQYCIGKAILIMHDYVRAVEYFRNALQSSPQDTELRLELARLYIKLNRNQEAIDTLMPALKFIDDRDRRTNKLGNNSNASHRSTADPMDTDVETLCLMTKAYIAENKASHGRQCLVKAIALQDTLIQRSKSKLQGGRKAVHQTIKTEMRKFYDGSFNSDTEVGCCWLVKELLDIPLYNEDTLEDLANLSYKLRDYDLCKKQASLLLSVNKNNEKGMLILASATLQLGDKSEATKLYEELLERFPNNYDALSKFIQLTYMCGRLEDVLEMIARTVKADSRSVWHAGLHYCKGLYFRYTNNAPEAAKLFNLARKDGKWGALSLKHLIHIYIDPNIDLAWLSSTPSCHAENLQTANTLLLELKNIIFESGITNFPLNIIQNYILLASKEHKAINEARRNFSSILEENDNNIPGLVGMSISLILDGMSDKASNILKHITKMSYETDTMEEVEQAYLLLTGLYVEQENFESAQKLCKLWLKYAESSSKAWETMGFIKEKENQHEVAAECYGRSWELENNMSATVGYKLSFNYLKIHQYVDAIEISKKVLNLYPNHAGVKAILNQSFAMLRP